MKKETDVEQPDGASLKEESEGAGRLVHLDAFRILGVAGVILAHGYDAYLVTNSAYMQNWGMQVFFIVCGICWSMSSRPAWSYALRLVTFFCMGTFMNWLGWVMDGADWKNNLWDVVYQMWFALGVATLVLVTGPIKWALQRRGPALWIAAAGYCTAAAVVAFLWLSGSWGRAILEIMLGGGQTYYASYADDSGFYTLQCLALFALVALAQACLLHFDGHAATGDASLPWGTQFIAWGLILCTYLPSIFLYEPLGAWIHDIELFFLGLVVQRFSMYGQVQLARFISAYWPLVMIWPIGAMTIPYEPARRIDMFPLHSLEGRARFMGMEFVFCMAFVVCGTPADVLKRQCPVAICKDPFNVLPWLNRWALFAYMCHMSFIRVIPEPFNLFAIYGSALAFLAEDVMRRAKKLPSPPEVFSQAWGVFLVPCLVWLCGSASSCILWVFAGLLLVGGGAVAGKYTRDRCGRQREGYKGCVGVADGTVPLANSSRNPLGPTV